MVNSIMHLHLYKIRLCRTHLCWYNLMKLFTLVVNSIKLKILLINTERFSNVLDENFMTSYVSLFVTSKTLFWTASKFDWTPDDIRTEKIISAPIWTCLTLIWATYFWRFSALLDVGHCPMLPSCRKTNDANLKKCRSPNFRPNFEPQKSSYKIQRKTNEPNLRKWQKT